MEFTSGMSTSMHANHYTDWFGESEVYQVKLVLNKAGRIISWKFAGNFENLYFNNNKKNMSKMRSIAEYDFMLS